MNDPLTLLSPGGSKKALIFYFSDSKWFYGLLLQKVFFGQNSPGLIGLKLIYFTTVNTENVFPEMEIMIKLRIYSRDYIWGRKIANFVPH